MSQLIMAMEVCIAEVQIFMYLFSQGTRSGDTSTVQENMQGFYRRSVRDEVLLVLRRRTRDGQVAYQLPGRGKSRVFIRHSS